jgi:hypothetical protein
MAIVVAATGHQPFAKEGNAWMSMIHGFLRAGIGPCRGQRASSSWFAEGPEISAIPEHSYIGLSTSFGHCE